MSQPSVGTNVARMLSARSIAVVGASSRKNSFGERLATEVLRSPSAPQLHFVNPRLDEVLGQPCVPSLAEVPEPVDLVLLGVKDAALVDSVATAAARGDGGAVIFGSAHGLGPQLTAAADGMALCGAGCMGFVNGAEGIRAIGYLERHPLPAGPIALVTHSGSVFSALLRTHRRLDFAVAVSSGQELVTTTADYLAYALELEQTRVVGLLLETLRDTPRLRAALHRAAEADVPVVALTVGGSPTGRAMVGAHSGALAGDDAAWEALFAAYGVHRAHDLDELADSLELFAIGRRVRSGEDRLGIATVHDSGAERALVADVASEVGVPFAAITDDTRATLTDLLDEGLTGDNPLDVWGGGAETQRLFTDCMSTLAADPSVGVVALAVDLVPEYDEDDSYPRAVEVLLRLTDKPVVVLSNMAAAVDQVQATALRAAGIPVLEGTRSGLRSLQHLLDQAHRVQPTVATIDRERQARWSEQISAAPLDVPTTYRLLEDYGLQTAVPHAVSSAAHASKLAASLGFPVVLKTALPAIQHKSDVDGVHTGLSSEDSVAAAYEDLATRLGDAVVIQKQAAAGVELGLGLVRDPLLGPLLLVAAGGTLIELLGQRQVALPPLEPGAADALLGRLEVSRLLAGFRGGAPVDRAAAVAALVALSQLAAELGDVIEALDLNPLIVTASGAVVVDVLIVPRQPDQTASRTRPSPD